MEQGPFAASSQPGVEIGEGRDCLVVLKTDVWEV